MIICIVGVLVMSFLFMMLLFVVVVLIYGDGGGCEFLEFFAFMFVVGVMFWWFCWDYKD